MFAKSLFSAIAVISCALIFSASAHAGGPGCMGGKPAGNFAGTPMGMGKPMMMNGGKPAGMMNGKPTMTNNGKPGGGFTGKPIYGGGMKPGGPPAAKNDGK